MIKKIISIISITSLSACGGGGGGGGSSTGVAPGAQTGTNSYLSMYQNGERLIDKYKNENITPANRMPTSGSATYRGQAIFEGSDQIISNVRMTANFNAKGGDVSGVMNNFRTNKNQEIGGNVNIERANFTHGDSFRNQLSGNLNHNGSNMSIGGHVDSEFIGRNANAIVGVVNATVNGTPTLGAMGAEK